MVTSQRLAWSWCVFFHEVLLAVQQAAELTAGEHSLLFMLHFWGEILTAAGFHVSPHLWTPVLADRNLEGPDEAIETLRLSALCPSLPRGNAEKA